MDRGSRLAGGPRSDVGTVFRTGTRTVTPDLNGYPDESRVEDVVRPYPGAGVPSRHDYGSSTGPDTSTSRVGSRTYPTTQGMHTGAPTPERREGRWTTGEVPVHEGRVRDPPCPHRTGHRRLQSPVYVSGVPTEGRNERVGEGGVHPDPQSPVVVEEGYREEQPWWPGNVCERSHPARPSSHPPGLGTGVGSVDRFGKDRSRGVDTSPVLVARWSPSAPVP